MAETDWTFLNDGLDAATVDRGVTTGVARPPGGGSFVFGFNSLATATMVDFYQRFAKKGASDAHYLFASRVTTALWGGFACVIALQAGKLGSAIEVVNRFGSYFYGSILGVFALAVAPGAKARGAFYGLFVGMAAVAAVSAFTRIHFLWYNVVGAVSVFAAGLLISALGGEDAGRREA